MVAAIFISTCVGFKLYAQLSSSSWGTTAPCFPGLSVPRNQCIKSWRPWYS